MHNGVINGFQAMRRDLLYAVDSSLFDGVHGSTDSEALFYLALTFGLEDDPIGAVERAVGLVEATAEAHGIEHPVQMTLGFSDGERLYAVRYSTEHSSRTLFVSEDVAAVRALHPDNARFQRMTDEDRVVVSEPVSRPPRGVARGARVDRADHPTRPRRAARVHTTNRRRGRALTMGVPSPKAAGSTRLSLVLAAAMFVLVVDTSLMNVSIAAVVRTSTPR